MVWKRQYFEDIFTKDDWVTELLKYLIDDKGVCKTPSLQRACNRSGLGQIVIGWSKIVFIGQNGIKTGPIRFLSGMNKNPKKVIQTL